MSDATELVCPSCELAHPARERFCERCGMPLVQAAAPPQAPTARQRRARKIKPQYTEGPLVEVARADNLIQAEFIAGLLLEEGIPSTLSATIAGYSPLVGARHVLVAQSGAQAAREALSWRREQGATPEADGSEPAAGE